MQHDINPAESPSRLVPELQTPRVTRRRSPLTRLLDLLAVRPGLARMLSDGLLLLALCGGGLGAVAYYQHAAATRPAPLAGMAELHAQLIEVPPTPAPTGGASAVARGPQGAAQEAAPAAPVPAPATGVSPAPSAGTGNRPGTRVGTTAGSTAPRSAVAAAPAAAAPAKAALPQEVRPITGAAREVVQRLTRAAGLIVPEAALARPTATVDVARALTRAGKPVTAGALAALEAAPDDPAVIEDVTLRLRGFVPPAKPAPAAAAVQAQEVPGGPEAVPAPARRPTASPGGATPGEAAKGTPPAPPPARAQAAVDRAQAGKAASGRVPQAQGPEPLPGPPRPAASGKPAPGKALSATLDDPLPVNWLQAMTEQAVTPLTPRN